VTVADEQEKSIEMRLAAIEDKLAQMNVTEDELKAYNKVAGLMAGGGVQPQAGCTTCSTGCLTECLIRACTIVRSCTIYQCTIIRACTYECLDCTGPCNVGGLGRIGGGGFGGLGG
jgi:hypothetical protein